jgi:hypothetical protein
MCATTGIMATTTITNFTIVRMLKGNRTSQKRSFHALPGEAAARLMYREPSGFLLLQA